jgi:hypothetical protein
MGEAQGLRQLFKFLFFLGAMNQFDWPITQQKWKLWSLCRKGTHCEPKEHIGNLKGNMLGTKEK